jgi:serine/threonine protein kinase
LEYLAPELVKGEPQNSAVDWWTLGILLYEMMCGTTPFRSATSDEVLAKIVCSDRIHWESGIGSPDARKLVKKLLHRDPKKRLGAEQGATEIKKSNFFASINFSLIRNEKPPIIPSDVPSLSDFDGVDLERDERLAKHMGDSDSDPDDNPPTDNDKAFAQFDMQRAQTDLSQY